MKCRTFLGNDEVAEALINKRPDMNRVSNNGTTALIAAITAGTNSNRNREILLEMKYFRDFFYEL